MDGVEHTTERCDVCIVGASAAGLNAPFAASRCLTPDQRIIVVDPRPRVGGMWVHTYPRPRAPATRLLLGLFAGGLLAARSG